jgi:hypothetical protein
MATPTLPPGIGVVDVEIDQLDVAPDYLLNAVRLEIVNPGGDGVRCWLDFGMALDVALRLAASVARLRKVIP